MAFSHHDHGKARATVLLILAMIVFVSMCRVFKIDRNLVDASETGGRSNTAASPAAAPNAPTVSVGSMVVLGYNDLGMHCMNQDFSELCILPPYNTLHAQVIDRSGEEPRIVTSGVTVNYRVPGNTISSTKTNFWRYAPALFGVNLARDVGLTGSRLSGQMKPTGVGDWSAVGIPITPINDQGRENPYQLSQITVKKGTQVTAKTAAVVPVSWEISCNLCHNAPGVSVATDILMKHDAKHGTKLVASKPVLCAGCHADPALGTQGVAGVSTLSGAMHASHATRMEPVSQLGNTCYACHPGFRTNCQRDVHYAKGIFCTDCHGGMASVGAANRTPWVDEPRCESCHKAMRPNFAFEQPGKLFKESKGHHGVYCASCHGSPHAVTPAVTAPDNYQSVMLQGHAGPIDKCTLCHQRRPDDSFEHAFEDDD